MPAGAKREADVAGRDDTETIVATIDQTGSIKPTGQAGPAALTPGEPNAVAVQQPVVVSPEPVPEAQPAAPTPTVVYVTAPLPPKRKGNRLVGAAVALVASFVYAAVLALVFAIVWASITGGADLGFVGSPNFFIPVVFFVAGMVLLALVLNRAKWWAYILGSIVVALIVYLGSAGVLLLLNNVVLETRDTAAQMFRLALLNPLVIISALVAREVAMWFGLIISLRGRRVTLRNAEARLAFEREERERATHPAATA